MSQSRKNTFQLNLKIDGESEFQKLSVFDGKNKLVHQKIGKIGRIELPRGLYRVEVELTGQTQSNVVRHVDEKKHEIKLPESYSSIPLAGYSSSPEYYIVSACNFSKEVTCRPKRISEVSGTNSLFVFLRFPNTAIFQKHKTKDSFKGFTFLNAERKHICTLNDDNCKIDKKHGSLSFCIKLPPGQYYLRYSGEKHREIPIYIHNHWHTQLFMTITSEPLFSSVKLLMGQQMGFDPQSLYSKSVDIAFLKLQNGDYQISEKLRKDFARDKWDNPIMGILGIYLYLLSGASNDDELYKTIINNLTRQIRLDENAPDMKILRLMSNEHHGKVAQEVQFEHPPMFLAGYKEIINRSTSDSYLLKENSNIDKYSAKLYWDSPITSYAFEKEIEDLENMDEADMVTPGTTKLSSVLAISQQKSKKGKRKAKKIKINTAVDWVIPSIFESTIAREDSEKPISIEQIAKDLELPQITVKRNISNLITGMKQSSDTASGIFDLLNTMTSGELTDSESVMGFLNKLNNKDTNEISRSGIFHTERKYKYRK